MAMCKAAQAAQAAQAAPAIPHVPNEPEVMYPKSLAALNDARTAVAQHSHGGELGPDPALVAGKLPYVGLSPQEVSATRFLDYLRNGAEGRELGGAHGLYRSPESLGYEFLRDPRYFDPSSSSLTQAGTNLLESVSSGDIDWNDVDTVTGRARSPVAGGSLRLPDNFVHRTRSFQPAPVQAPPPSMSALGRIEAKRPSSMYPKSTGIISDATRAVDEAAKGESPVDGSVEALARNLGASSMSPAELSAMGLYRGLLDKSLYRGGAGSIDMDPESQVFELLRDPAYVDAANQALTPAGSNIMERVSGKAADGFPWGKVDNVLGRGIGIKGRNVPLPQGFSHAFPSYETEAKADEDRAAFSAAVQRAVNKRLAAMSPEERYWFARKREDILARKAGRPESWLKNWLTEEGPDD